MYKKVHAAIRKDPSPAPKKQRKEKTKTAAVKVSKRYFVNFELFYFFRKMKSSENLKVFLKNKEIQKKKNEFLADMGISA